jgi:uncharacterized protein
VSLQEQIKADLKKAYKEKNEELKETLRVIIGEFDRQTKKILNDSEVVKIITKMYNDAKECYEKPHDISYELKNNSYINTLKSYLPTQATIEEVEQWIKENIDFSKYKNRIQAMKDVMVKFAGRIDGNAVRKLLEKDNGR